MRKLMILALALSTGVAAPAHAYSYAETLADKIDRCIALGGTPESFGSNRVGANRYVPYVNCRLANGAVIRT